jgi:hypothetical protein
VTVASSLVAGAPRVVVADDPLIPEQVPPRRLGIAKQIKNTHVLPVPLRFRMPARRSASAQQPKRSNTIPRRPVRSASVAPLSYLFSAVVGVHIPRFLFSLLTSNVGSLELSLAFLPSNSTRCPDFSVSFWALVRL